MSLLTVSIMTIIIHTSVTEIISLTKKQDEQTSVPQPPVGKSGAIKLEKRRN